MSVRTVKGIGYFKVKCPQSKLIMKRVNFYTIQTSKAALLL